MIERGVQGLTGAGVVPVAGFCALYGLILVFKVRAPGTMPGLVDYASGVAAALLLFMPAYAFAAVAAPFAPTRLVARALVLAVVVAAGVGAGYALAGLAQDTIVSWRGGGARHATAWLSVQLTAWVGLAIFLLLERERAAAQAVHDELKRKLELERRMSEARLQVLQAQIEPHFLFNSLAHVRRLCRTNAPAGRAMLRHLAHYLGAALPALQHPSIRLGADVDLAVAYLNVLQIRMGGRLRFRVDVDVASREARVPPMTVTTLVENAIKHGLSPLEEGGEVRIAACAHEDAVVVDIVDDGRGFQSTIGTGVGIANVRGRLAMLHGDEASLALSINAPRGVVATVVLPRHARAAAAA